MEALGFHHCTDRDTGDRQEYMFQNLRQAGHGLRIFLDHDEVPTAAEIISRMVDATRNPVSK